MTMQDKQIQLNVFLVLAPSSISTPSMRCCAHSRSESALWFTSLNEKSKLIITFLLEIRATRTKYIANSLLHYVYASFHYTLSLSRYVVLKICRSENMSLWKSVAISLKYRWIFCPVRWNGLPNAHFQVANSSNNNMNGWIRNNKSYRFNTITHTHTDREASLLYNNNMISSMRNHHK